MGKLGGRELGYHSDLDVIFVHDAGDPAWWRERTVPGELFTRIAQRTISVLQTPTAEGVAYRIDTRLRPSGNQGALVTSLEAFEAYHRTSAALWERQALVKARVVSGPPDLRERLEAAIAGFVYGRGLTGEEAAALREMRARIAEERGAHRSGEVNIKTDPGGLVDVEFAVQMLQLRHGHAEPRVRRRGTRRALDALAACGLLDAESARALRDGWDFLRALEGRLRIERDQPVEAFAADPATLASLAQRMGFAGTPAEAAQALQTTHARHRAAIRAAFTRVFDEAVGS
jgi:glutamate-ammonia-ligase adenylyltransferase